MKKVSKGITLAAVIAAMILACSAGMKVVKAAYEEGIRHAIEDSIIWTVDIYNPDNPEDSAWNGYDQRIIIELDGEWYEHGMIQC